MASRALKIAQLLGDAVTDGSENVGTEPLDLVQLDSESALPVVSGKNLTEIVADASLDWANRSPIATFKDTQDPALPFGWTFIQEGGTTPNMPETCTLGWIERVSLGSEFTDSSGGAGSYFLDTFVAYNYDGTVDTDTIDTEHRWTRYCNNGVFGEWKRIKAEAEGGHADTSGYKLAGTDGNVYYTKIASLYGAANPNRAGAALEFTVKNVGRVTTPHTTIRVFAWERGDFNAKETIAINLHPDRINPTAQFELYQVNSLTDPNAFEIWAKRALFCDAVSIEVGGSRNAIMDCVTTQTTQPAGAVAIPLGLPVAGTSLDWGNRSPVATYTDTQDPALPFGWSFIQSGGTTPNMPETCTQGWIERVALGSEYADSSGVGAGSAFLDTFVAYNYDGVSTDSATTDTEHRWTRYCNNGVFNDWKRIKAEAEGGTADTADQSLDWGNRVSAATYNDCNDVTLPVGWNFIADPALNTPTGESGWIEMVQTGATLPDNVMQRFVPLDGRTGRPQNLYIRWNQNRANPVLNPWSEWICQTDHSVDWGDRHASNKFTDTQDPTLPFGWSFVQAGGLTPNMPPDNLNGWLERVSIGNEYSDPSGAIASSYFVDTFVTLGIDGDSAVHTEERWSRINYQGTFGPWRRLTAEANSLSASNTVTLNDISDVSAATPITDQYLKWDGSAWVPAAVDGGGGLTAAGDEFAAQNYTGNGATTTYAIAHDAGKEMVYLNGILQLEGSGNDYTTNPTLNQVTFATAPASGAVIQLRGFSTASVV